MTEPITVLMFSVQELQAIGSFHSLDRLATVLEEKPAAKKTSWVYAHLKVGDVLFIQYGFVWVSTSMSVEADYSTVIVIPILDRSWSDSADPEISGVIMSGSIKYMKSKADKEPFKSAFEAYTEWAK